MTPDRREDVILTLTLNRGLHEKYREQIEVITRGSSKNLSLGAEDTLLLDYRFYVDYIGGCSRAIEHFLTMLDDPDLVVNYHVDVINHQKSLMFELGSKLEQLARRAEAANAPETPSWSRRQEVSPEPTQPTPRRNLRQWVKSWFSK